MTLLSSTPLRSIGRQTFRGRSLILGGAILWYILQSLSIMNDAPPASPDGAVFADGAHNLITTGRLGTDLVVGMESHSYWQPPGYYLALAAIFKLFGYGLWQLRLLSICFGGMCLWAVYALSSKAHSNQTASVLAVVLLAFDPVFVKWVRWDRTDSLCEFFVLCSLIAYLTAITKKGVHYWVAAGVCASVATLIHPYGVLSFAVTGLHFLFARRPALKETLYFSIPAIVFFCGWGAYILQGPQEFLVQFQYQINRKAEWNVASLMGTLAQYRFYPSYAVVILSGLAALVVNRKEHPWNQRSVLVFSVLVALCSCFVIRGPYYHTYLAPFLAVAASIAVVRFLQSGLPVFRRIVMALVALVVVNGVAYTGALTYLYKWELRQKADHEVLVRQILERVPLGSKIGHLGYPTPYWILHELQAGGRLRELYVLRAKDAREVFRDLDYLVYTQCSDTSYENGLTQCDVVYARDVLRHDGRRLQYLGQVGANDVHAYRAYIYSIENDDQRKE